jgi:secreted trypsin-like serine protease
MLRFRLTHPVGSFLVAVLALATAMVAGHAMVAADSGAELKLKPDKHDFGPVVATAASAPLAITVTNKSRTDSITFSSIVATETFSIQSDNCSGSPLAPGRSCKLEIVFHPLVTGKVNDQNGLTFTDSAQNSPQYIELDGQGTVGSFF